MCVCEKEGERERLVNVISSIPVLYHQSGLSGIHLLSPHRVHTVVNYWFPLEENHQQSTGVLFEAY